MTNYNRNIFLWIAAVYLLLLAVYANHFNNGFHFDDWHAIVDNVHIRNLKNIPSFFTDPKMFSNDPQHWGIRALVTTTLAVDYWLTGGLVPFYFQADTFIWYLFLCLMVFFTYKKILTNIATARTVNYMALGAFAWYSLHTVNAETLNYIIARSDVISTFCIVAAFLIYIAFPAKRKWYLYLIPAVIGVFAKETMLVLVILLFFYYLLFEQKLSIYDVFKAGHFKQVVKAFTNVLPLLVIVSLVQYYTLSRIAAIPGISNPWFYYLLTQSYVWLHYFISFFLPLTLSADTDWTVIYQVFDIRIITGLIFILLLIIAIFKTSKYEKLKPISFGLIWFAAALLPTSLAPFAEVANDHRMFFPFIGLSLSVVAALGLCFQQVSFKAYRIPALSCFIIIISLNAYGVYQRNKVWHTEESLWLDVTKKSPANGRGLMNYGLTQMQKGNYAAAHQYFTSALKYLSNYNVLYINLGVLNGAMNKPDAAEQNFKKGIKCSPNTFDGYAFYARYLQQTGQYIKAQPLAEKALQLNRYSLMTLTVLMEIYVKLGEWDKLKLITDQILAISPKDATAQNYNTLAKKALAGSYKSTLTAQDYLNISLAYYNQKAYQKCIAACLDALKLRPDYADAYNNMGAAYNNMGQWANAIAACKRALQINPRHQLAAGNLKWAESQLNK